MGLFQARNSHMYRAALSFAFQIILGAQVTATAVVLGFPGNS